jgi:two-component system, cell cycle sensor histidine kinase and response regulator CckA
VSKMKKVHEIPYRQILDLAPAVIYLKDRQGRYTFVNRHFELLSGFPARQVLDKTDFELFPEEVACNSSANDQKVLESGIPLETEELGPVDGRMHTFISAKFPIYDAQGAIVELCGISTDITARKEAERSLRISEERFRVALEANPDPVLLCDLLWRVVYLNTAFSHVFGWTLQDTKGRPLERFFPEPERPGLSRLLQTLLAERHLPVTETRHLTKDRRILAVMISGSFYNDDAGKPVGFILNLRDISAQKRLQRQVDQAHRLASLGKLAGGIAHNFNNLLMGIQGSVDLLRQVIDPGCPGYKNLATINRCVKSGADLTQQLLGMAQTGKFMPEPIDVNASIRLCLEEFGCCYTGIEINRSLQEGIGEIVADRAQFHLVLSTLFTNAGQAMGQKGRLFVSSASTTVREDVALLYDLPAGRYVRISVSDTGAGLDQASQEHIFDPFFATFSVKTGKGLGLASAYGIIRNHGGIITVDSEPERGTTFNVYLPDSRTTP